MILSTRNSPAALALSLLGQVFGRERRLPAKVLQSYVAVFVRQRDLYLQSASAFGTPQYYFDEPALSRQVDRFRNAFSRQMPRCRIFYAMKSNSLPRLCRRIVAEGIGLDVSSGAELAAALDLGCGQIVFSGPGKTEEELGLAVRNASRVTLLMDSWGELARVARVIERGDGGPGEPLRGGIRVRSERLGQWRKFGIPLEELAPFLDRARKVKGLSLRGIQFHTSWNLDPRNQLGMIREIASTIRRSVPMEQASGLEFLDVGGGFWPERGEWLNAQNTFRGEVIRRVRPAYPLKKEHYLRPGTPIGRFARSIAAALADAGPPLANLEVWTEPGRWICTPAMHVLLRVLEKKGPRAVVTDGGINLLGWERPLTEFIPLINLTRPSTREIPCSVYGSLCTPMDIWGFSVFGDGLEAGDILLVPEQGAYTYALRQAFIKPVGRVVHFDGERFEERDGVQRRPLDPA